MKTDEDDDTQLADFEAGFLMGHFEALGIQGEPTIEQFNAAATALERVRTRMEERPQSGSGVRGNRNST